MENTKYNVLVTGGAGYLGCQLSHALLREGFRVYCVDGLLYNQEKSLFSLIGDKDFLFRPTDVRDIDSFKDWIAKADIVIPLAAIVGAPACNKQPDFAREVNMGAIRGLLAQTSKQQRVVYPNTNSGYGVTDGESFVTEESHLTPISLYGQTKCESEKMVLDHPLGVSLRLATVFGPSARMRFDLLVNDFVAKLVHTGKLEIFEPHFKRNFVHIRDVARVFIEMSRNHALRGVYNVGLDEANMSKWLLAQTICEYLGIDNAGVTEGAGSDSDKRNYIVSSQKLLNTGFKCRHSLREGVYDVANICGILSPQAVARMGNI